MSRMYLFGLLLLWCLPVCVGAVTPVKRVKPIKPKLYNVEITYMQSTATPSDESGNGTSKVTTSWFVPAGHRQEMPDGRISIFLLKGPSIYFLNPETKTASHVNFSHVKSSFTSTEEKKMVTGLKRVFKNRTLRKEKFLGRECEVTQITTNTPNGRLEIIVWSAQVGGHSVTLRSLSKTYKDGKLAQVDLQEAIRIQAVPTAPSDLLKVSEDYSVTNVDTTLFNKVMPEIMQKIFPPSNDPH